MAATIASKTRSKKNFTKSKPDTLDTIIKKITFVSYLEKGELLATFQTPKVEDVKLAISKAIIKEGIQYGLNIITDQYYNDHLFESVYFSKYELMLGYTQRPKHTLLLETITYYIDVIIEGDETKLVVVTAKLEPQIVSNPKDWMARIRHLKSTKSQ